MNDNVMKREGWEGKQELLVINEGIKRLEAFVFKWGKREERIEKKKKNSKGRTRMDN